MYITDINEEIMCQSNTGNKIYWMLTSEQGAPNFEMRYIEIPPGAHTSYGHHPHEHEVFVVNGKGKVKGKDTEHDLSPRMAVFIPGDEEHQFINASETEPFGVLCVIPISAEAELKPPCRKK